LAARFLSEKLTLKAPPDLDDCCFSVSEIIPRYVSTKSEVSTPSYVDTGRTDTETKTGFPIGRLGRVAEST